MTSGVRTGVVRTMRSAGTSRSAQAFSLPATTSA